MKIGPMGYLGDPDLHDGYLTGLELIEEHILQIRLRNVVGKRFTMELSGLHLLLANEIRQGNIILNIRIEHRRDPDPSLMRQLIGGLHPSVGEPYRTKHEDYFKRMADAVRNGDLTLVAVEASYGCDLVALCKSASIAEG